MFARLLLPLLVLSASGFAQPTNNDQLPIQAEPVKTMGGWEWTNCGLDSDPMQIESIDVSPDPPKPGQDMTVTVKGDVKERIEDGAYADVTVKLGLIKLLTRRFDACEEARKANTTIQCPVEPGPQEVEQTVALPKEIPPGKFLVSIRGYTAYDEDMVCLDLSVDFRKRFQDMF